MLYGTLFGTIHSDTLRLIPEITEVSPAAPKTSLVEIPGGNGSVDLTEALGAGVVYSNRTIKWTFTLYPGTDWASKRSEVANAISGKRLKITLDEEPGWYYEGRVSVNEYKTDKLYHQITIEATCAPYKRKTAETSVSAELSTEFSEISCAIGQMPLVPLITVEQETVVQYGDYSITVQAGAHLLPDMLMSGTQIIKAKTTSGSGSISITWREGSL